VIEEELETLKAKNDRLKGQVERLQEKEAIQADLEKVGTKKIIIRYVEDVEKYQTAKDEMQIAMQKYEELTAALGTLKEKVKSTQRAAENAKERETKATDDFTKCLDTLKTLSTKIEDADKNIEEMKRKMESVIRLDTAHKQKMREMEMAVRDMERSLNEKRATLKTMNVMDDDGKIPSSVPAILQINAKIAECNERLSQLRAEKSAFESEYKNFAAEKARLARQKDDKLAKLRDLDNVRTRRLVALKRADPGLHDAVLWLRENISRFKGRVTEPVMLEIEPKHPKYANLIENSIPFKVLKVLEIGLCNI
jgi:chromosome segregation ATPase